MAGPIYDLVIIGGGPGGYTAAIRAAQFGMTVALVEMDKVGGVCLNRGCIPTAVMLHCGELYRKTRESEQLGICTNGIKLDYEKLLAYRDETVRTMIQGVEQRLGQYGIKRYAGKGTLLANGLVRVDSEAGRTELTAKNVILATGSTARTPDIPGIALSGVTDSDGALAWRSLPESLTVIGGGVIGVEYAQMFSDLGSKVTLLGTRDRLLPSLDKEISQSIKMTLKKRGIDVKAGVSVKQIERGKNTLHCYYMEKESENKVDSQHVLYAVGRVPNTEGLFDDVDVRTDHGRIIVDGHYQTSVEGVYAVGDVIGGAQTAHLAMAQGTAAVEYIAGRKPSVDADVVPICVYTDPEIASVGLTERQAKEAGCAVIIGKSIMGRNGRSTVTREERSFIKVIASAADGVILGAQFMCARAGDMVGELVSAIANRFTAEQLLRAIRPHPTYNEALADALASILQGQKTIH